MAQGLAALRWDVRTDAPSREHVPVGKVFAADSRASRSALSRFFARHGITFKKSLQAEERKRADVARARRRWIREQGWLDNARLVFIDETAVTTNMVRLNGWSPCGERLVADAPMGHWETITFIAGLRQTGIVAPMLIKGAMNGEAFLAYIEQCLAPTLKHGDIVVWMAFRIRANLAA